MSSVSDDRGSTWKRWDPHIHTPGTLLANRYESDDPWESFLTEIEESEPRIRALGVTDYANLREYERVVERKANGRLPDVELIFANVELRYETATVKGTPINFHLLLSPEQEGWLDRAREFLGKLTFGYQDDQFRCDEAGLIRLGRVHAGSNLDDDSALKAGVNQFKVTRAVLAEAIEKDLWARRNVIVGVSGTSGDGTAGISKDAGLAATRSDMQRMAQVIFASAPEQREFWLGRGVDSVETLKSRYGGVKLCLHGSDAHTENQVGKPDLNRFSWIKGDLSFESLRQACIEPELRAVVAEAPPDGPAPSRTIAAVEVEGTDWFANGSVPLNPGLVGIIGARGSGKTALADLIAAGAGVSDDGNPNSFLHVKRAGALLAGTTIRLRWQDDVVTERVIRQPIAEDDAGQEKVRYLSQQFVERLCSAEGVGGELLHEIERVVFGAHDEDARDGATDFRDLLAIRTDRERTSRRHHEQAMAEIGAQIDDERAKHGRIPLLTSQVSELASRVVVDKGHRDVLQATTPSVDAVRLQEVSLARDVREKEYTVLRRRRQSLLSLRDEIHELATRELPSRIDRLQREHQASGLMPAEWTGFQLRFAGDPAEIVDGAIKRVDDETLHLLGPELAESADSQVSVAQAASLLEASLRALRMEVGRLTKALGLDKERVQKLEAIQAKIRAGERNLEVANIALTDAQGALDRIDALRSSRDQAYASIFNAIRAEEEQLKALYVPVGQMLADAKGALSKLEFVVRRTVDVDSWAATGEDLLDSRTEGNFRGRGSIALTARADGLAEAWQSGTGEEVATALASFRSRHSDSLRKQMKQEYDTPDARRVWESKVSEWLVGTGHISLTYAIQYEGVPIEQLSPGTRGIVLLLLYLSLDQTDDRPLIIDQPEENLDPESIFNELVGQFRSARLRRQVIIVTHNANLIVNTDADQVIVASVGKRKPGELPPLSYVSGGIEEKDIRDRVCKVLEGGADAFRDRARRLRVRLP